MSGTEIAYGTVSLCACYAMSGTERCYAMSDACIRDVRYGDSVGCCARSGTEIAYTANSNARNRTPDRRASNESSISEPSAHARGTIKCKTPRSPYSLYRECN
eukprot:107794-Rhodomonas_salina.1